MLIEDYYLVFPEGDIQEIAEKLTINDLVDLNGHRLNLPLPTERLIVYRIYAIKTKDETGSRRLYHFGELVPAQELAAYVRRY